MRRSSFGKTFPSSSICIFQTITSSNLEKGNIWCFWNWERLASEHVVSAGQDHLLLKTSPHRGNRVGKHMIVLWVNLETWATATLCTHTMANTNVISNGTGNRTFLENDLKWLEICTRFFHGWNFLILGAAHVPYGRRNK